MKKKLLFLVSLFAMMHLGMSAGNPAENFDWYYGQYPGVKVGDNNTMPTFGIVNGYARPGVKIEIPGIAEEQTIERFNDEGQIEQRDIYLLDLSSKKVHIQGPIVEGSSTTKVDVNKAIFACYPSNEWPVPFADGKQECKAFRFGLMSYEVSKLPGTYKVTFPAGALYINGEPCEEFSVEFNVKDNTVYEPYNFSFEVSPMANYGLQKLIYPQISIINWDSDTNKELYMTKGVSPEKEVTLTNQETNEVLVCPFSNVGGTVTKLVWEADLQCPGGIKTPGTYILRIPEGTIRLQDLKTGQYVTNYDLEYTFIVEGEKNYYEGGINITPAAGNVTSIQCLEINQPKGYAVALPSTVVPFKFTMPDGTEKSVMPRDGWRGHTIYIDLDAPFTAKGEYTLSIPEGGILYYKATSDGDIADESNPMITKSQSIKYNLTWGEEADLACTTDPANNAIVFNLENLYITFDETITPTYGLLATVKWPDGTTVHYPQDFGGNEDQTALPYQYKVTYSEQNKRFMVGLHYPQMKGIYEITIPAGIAKTADGKINKEFTVKVNWSDREVVDIDIQTDPKSGESLVTIPQEIYLTLPSDVSSSRLGDSGLTTVLFYTPGASSAVNRYIKAAGSKYYVDLRESFEFSKETEGLYTIQIPEGSFICTMSDGREVFNATKTYSWRLAESGVYEVSVDNGRVTVYDLNGTLLMRDADKEQLHTLKGVYIVNGVKTLL